jgi:hypothetical protein
LKLSAVIEADFKGRLPDYHKSRREGLCLLSALMLEVRTSNLMELSAALPRDIAHADERYRYIERLLANPHIDADAVSAAYIGEIFERLSAQGQTIVLMMDQSHINDMNEVLMVSAGLRERAIPVAWRVRSTQGGIGFRVQKDLLEAVRIMLPAGAKVMLAADRFYGTAALIEWCQAAGWDYRIRLKGNLTLTHEGGEMTTGEAVTRMPDGLRNAELYGSGVRTNVGILHEKGHKEPWIIAMNAVPGPHTTLDYSLRWGIEPMFSDFKSRGFGLMQSQIQRPERLERLILIMAIAMHWAISCGMVEEQITAQNEARRGGRKRGFAKR